MRSRLPLLLLIPVLLGSFAFHAYRAENPTDYYQSADERSYGRLAVDLAEIGQYGVGAGTNGLHWPPGAPMLFAVGHELFPDAASAETKDIPAAYWLQALVSFGSMLAAFGLATLLAGRWAGLAAAALVGFYPPLILASGEQLSEPLGAFFVIASFLALALAVTGRTWLGYPVAGLLFGAAVLTRTDLLLVPFIVPALVAFVLWRTTRSGRGALLAGGLLLLGALVALTPWTAYVSNRAGGFTPVTTGSSSALFVGTYLPGNGTTVGMKRALGAEAKRRNPKLRGTPDFDLEAKSVLMVIADRHPDLTYEQAVGREGRKNIVRYGTSDPVGFAGMMLNKVQRMWTRYARGGARPTSPWIRGWHILLVIGCVSGLVAGIWRGRSLVLGAILLAVLYATAVHMLVVSQARYNLPLMPALVAGGVAGWALFLARRRADREAGAAEPSGPSGDDGAREAPTVAQPVS